MVRRRYQVTCFSWGSRSVLSARSPEHLARQLEEATVYTTAVCHDLAGQLYRGIIVVDPEKETILAPGDVYVRCGRLPEDPIRVDAYLDRRWGPS